MACEKCRPSTGLYKSASDQTKDMVLTDLRASWDTFYSSQKKQYEEQQKELEGKELEELKDSYEKFVSVFKARYDEMINRIPAVADEALAEFKKEFAVTTLPAVKFN